MFIDRKESWLGDPSVKQIGQDIFFITRIPNEDQKLIIGLITKIAWFQMRHREREEN